MQYLFFKEHTNQDWWFVKKHLTEEKGWVPAQYLLDEVHYTIYLQRKLHEKIDRLPIFESEYLFAKLITNELLLIIINYFYYKHL